MCVYLCMSKYSEQILKTDGKNLQYALVDHNKILYEDS